jgi:hypothetical protein
MPSPEERDVATRLLALVPEFEERYPLVVILDSFADALRDWVVAGADPALVDRCLTVVERIATSGGPRARDLVRTCFLEAAAWGELGLGPRLGPETRALVRESDPRLLDPVLVDECR